MRAPSLLLNQATALGLHQVRLEPLDLHHTEGLARAVQDGDIYNLLVTTAPHPEAVKDYIQLALDQQQQSKRFAFAVIDENIQNVIGTTGFYDWEKDVKRIKIGYTWYAKSYQRTHVNTTCKLLLLQYAFEVLKAHTVAFETDILNIKSQNAIARIGAKKDGVLRGHKLRKDGTSRDTVVFSIIAEEWHDVKPHLESLIMSNYKA